jgi:hypothetical protein
MTLQEMIANYIYDARIGKDEIGLWWIAQCVHERLGVTDPEENKKLSLQIAQALINNDVMPGDLGGGPGTFKFWEGTPEELYARIESVWPKGRIPNLSDPGWFLYKSPKA